MKCLILFVFFILDVVSIHTAADECPIVKKTNGCSVPLDLEFPYKEEFKDICNKHDVCYVCGKTNNWTRIECDNAFYNEMKSYCKDPKNANKTSSGTTGKIAVEKVKKYLENAVKKASTSAAIMSFDSHYHQKKSVFEILMMIIGWKYIKNEQKACLHGALIYYKAVKVFGESSYAKREKDICKGDCAVKLGKPFR